MGETALARNPLAREPAIPGNVMPAAVKAVIHDGRGHFLLQQRDDIAGIYEPGQWGFFGGGVENGESPQEALSRELEEELEIAAIDAAPEVFRLDRGTYGILNIGLSLLIDMGQPLSLREGRSFQWFAVDEILDLPLSNLVIQNLGVLLELAEPFDRGVADRVEEVLLRRMNLRRKNERVYYARATPAAVSRRELALLRELARFRQLPFCRICLHCSDDESVHEMLMIHTHPLNVGPLRQDRNAALSYHMLEGAAEISLHDERGVRVWVSRIDSDRPEAPISVRLNASEFRSIRSLTPYAIFLEVASGPFRDHDTIWMTGASS